MQMLEIDHKRDGTTGNAKYREVSYIGLWKDSGQARQHKSYSYPLLRTDFSIPGSVTDPVPDQ